MKTNPLVGKTIKTMQLTTDKRAIRFVLTEGDDIIARADGDCCSSTWIEHVSLPARGFPAAVLEVSDLDMPDQGTPPDAECVTYYGCGIKTDRGDMVIDYRNESNGYYGGELSWPGDYFYGGVFGQNISSEEWSELTHDV